MRRKHKKTGARQHSRGRFHLLLPAVGVTTQEQTSEGGGQLRHYSPSWWHRSLSLAADLSIHGTGDPSSLGKDASHGCIRLSNDGITKLIHAVPLGTPVQIVA